MEQTALTPSTPQTNGQQPPKSKNDIMSRRNRPLARLWRSIRAITPWVLLIGLVIWCWTNPVVLNITLTILGFIFRIAFAIIFAIIQFVAIFWFMSQTKMETIKPEEIKSITFRDYWGQPNLVKLVQQWITLLSDREQFMKMGGKYINGILLYGPPGTGKTMLAKAMAGEAGIPFISVEGSGFRGMFWGVDVLRMIQYVGKAKKLAREYGACIAYIDEIDAVGASRGGVMGGGANVMGMMGGASGALTRLLYEMDGVEEKTRLDKLRERWYKIIGKEPPRRNWHVLFMGSTNRPDVLDPALLRPGRFDQKIRVDPPDKTGRREVIKGYLRKVKHDDTVNIEAIVEDTPHATPAEIAAAITKDAVRIALFNGRAKISQRDIDKALQEQDSGIPQPVEEMDPEQRRQVAYHEAGHVVALHYVIPEQRIVRVTIIRHSESSGHVTRVDRVEVYQLPIRRFAADIVVGMAGHVATKMFMGEYWTGAAGSSRSDFGLIRSRLWQLYQFGYFGPPVMGAENAGSNSIPSHATPMLERFWRIMEEQTEDLLRKHYSEVDAIAQALLVRDELSHDELMELLDDNGWQPSNTAFPRREPQTIAPKPDLLPLPAPVAVAMQKPEESASQVTEIASSEIKKEKPESVNQMIAPPTPAQVAARRPPVEPEKPVAEPPKTQPPTNGSGSEPA